MQFDGAVVKEQGVTFAIVVVKPHVIQSNFSADAARRNFSKAFPGLPVILMAQDSRGVPTYQGRKEIVNFLAKVHASRITWKRFSLN